MEIIKYQKKIESSSKKVIKKIFINFKFNKQNLKTK